MASQQKDSSANFSPKNDAAQQPLLRTTDGGDATIPHQHECVSHIQHPPGSNLYNGGNDDNMEDPPKQEDEDEDVEIIGEYGTDIWRIPLLFAYVIIMTSKAYMWISFSTIIDSAKDFYGITSAEINNIALTYNYCYLGAFWLSGIVFARVGLKWGLVLASGLCMTGAACRVMSVYVFYKSYPMLILGNLFSGLCQVIVLAAPPLVSNTWFPANERPFATAVGSASVFLGGGLGLLVPTFFVDKDHQGKDDFGSLHWFSFCLASLGFVAVVFLPKNPRMPPSPAALKQHGGVVVASSSNEEKLSFSLASLCSSLLIVFQDIKKTLKTMFSNTNFLLLVAMSSATIGICWELPALVPQITEPFGVSSSSAGWAGFACQASGFIATVCIGLVLSRTKDYKVVLQILAFGCLTSVVVFLCIFAFGFNTITYQGATAATILCWIAVMVFASAAFPLCFEIMVEETFPQPEATTGPILIFLISLATLVFTQIFAAVLGDNPTKFRAILVLAGNALFLVMGVVAATFMNLRYKRRAYEERVHEHSSPDAMAEEGVEVTVRSTADGRQIKVRRSLTHHRHQQAKSRN